MKSFIAAVVVAVIIAVPAPTAVTVVDPVVPEAGLTVSTAVLLEAQVTVRPVRVLPFTSFVVAVSCCVPPGTIGVVGAEIVTVATGTGFTVIVGVEQHRCPYCQCERFSGDGDSCWRRHGHDHSDE